MKNGSLKKYILPNMPYLFMAWACLKLGTAYRLAAGANAGQKLVGMMATINTAFASPAPGLDPADWLIGIAGAAAIRGLTMQAAVQRPTTAAQTSSAPAPILR